MPPEERVVYKQRYLSRNEPSVVERNDKHLIYIATRPGVICNRDSGFGLWGFLPDMKKMEDIKLLYEGRRAIREASKDHTVYRAVLSVDQDTAERYNLYDRSEWERLLRSRIAVIRSEMYIKERDFCFVAAVHHKKTHPHVHILFWDNGKEPKSEHIGKERFETMTEHIRQAFSGAILNREEITEDLRAVREEEIKARKMMCAWFKDANMAEALNLDRVRKQDLDALGRQLYDLAVHIPARGGLKYKYLPPPYKERLNAFLEDLLRVGEFQKTAKNYFKMNEEVSRLYGNSPKLMEEYQENARRKLYTSLGNETLKYLKELTEDIRRREPPKEIEEMKLLIRQDALLILRQSERYSEVLHSLPRWRTPRSAILSDDKLRTKIFGLTRELMSDIRLRSRVEAYDDTKRTSKDDVKSFPAAYRAVNDLVMETLEQDKGYREQEIEEIAVTGLLRLFCDLSRNGGQARAQRDLCREKYRNLSKTAKMDLRKKKEQAGDWEPEE